MMRHETYRIGESKTYYCYWNVELIAAGNLGEKMNISYTLSQDNVCLNLSSIHSTMHKLCRLQLPKRFMIIVCSSETKYLYVRVLGLEINGTRMQNI